MSSSLGVSSVFPKSFGVVSVFHFSLSHSAWSQYSTSHSAWSQYSLSHSAWSSVVSVFPKSLGVVSVLAKSLRLNWVNPNYVTLIIMSQNRAATFRHWVSTNCVPQDIYIMSTLTKTPGFFFIQRRVRPHLCKTNPIFSFCCYSPSGWNKNLALHQLNLLLEHKNTNFTNRTFLYCWFVFIIYIMGSTFGLNL